MTWLGAGIIIQNTPSIIHPSTRNFCLNDLCLFHSWLLLKVNTVRRDRCIVGTQEAEEEGRRTSSDLWTRFTEVHGSATLLGVDAAGLG